MTKREFLKTMAWGSAGLMLPSAKVWGANDRINVGVIGLRGKGNHHMQLFSEIPGVQVTALCDVDSDILDQRVKEMQEKNKVKAYTDVRELLDDKHIDAVVIATPNHWHSLMAVWACQAGKDVYVEKPVSHNVWEGGQIVKAAQKYKRIVQAGTQSRSDEALYQAFDYLQSGQLGKILLAHGLCYKPRKSIGRVDGPQPIPEQIDYDLWTGPAPLKPLRREQLHYDWHWQWDTGNGDIGNQGVHEMDMCRWVLGYDKLPEQVFSIGGRFGYRDDGETPNSQIAVFDYQPAPIIFEVRGLPVRKDADYMDNYKGVRIGIVVKCQEGYFAGGGGGGWMYDNDGNRIQQFSSAGGGGHPQNFIDAMRSRKTGDLKAPIREGHLSSALSHIANISHRIGHHSTPQVIQESIGNKFVNDTFRRFEEHLFANWVDPEKSRPVLGPNLTLNPETERFVSREIYDAEYWANRLVNGSYRKPFVMPDKV
ncbi:MAG: Gfo/Idh/MocA family oxidoreductase [candidate division KSB1 bacterium]|nr:Gfo/Idh/MocA family oxidoreductase [candidate division KSB1 bacterium]